MDPDLFFHNNYDPDSNPVGTSVAIMGKSYGENVYDQFFNQIHEVFFWIYQSLKTNFHREQIPDLTTKLSSDVNIPS